MSASIIRENISETLDAYSRQLFDVKIKIRRIEDSYENLITDLQQRVDAGIISKADSIESRDIANLWLNFSHLPIDFRFL